MALYYESCRTNLTLATVNVSLNMSTSVDVSNSRHRCGEHENISVQLQADHGFASQDDEVYPHAVAKRFLIYLEIVKAATF